MKKNYNVEFWNFVCHFGQHKLLDHYVDLVHPAFVNNHVRTYGDSRWLFNGVQLIEIDIDNEVLPFIYGRIVKDTILEREQILQDGDLVDDSLSMQSSPSSIFILSLKEHRIFFIKEHKDAPTMDSFKTTIERFINDERINLINEIFDGEKKQKEIHGGNYRVTKKKDLEVRYPKPDIEVIPLSSDADIEEFIKGMKSIDKLTLNLVMPNSESDCNGFFKCWRDENKKLKQSKSKVEFTKSKKSLPHDEVANLSKEAINDGNVLIKLNGKDINNDKLVGTHDEFKLTRSINEINETPTLLVKETYESFLGLIKDGVIREPRISNLSKVKEKIGYILSMLK
ncbi:hypothetical protein [Salinivibrio proteolyticus]|uniref:CD-NTase associated protein 4-like DNA endonuclease domain-containing protein n=1 Tax=Salinivibrio proteolyticus TaxID=334715 RepID=A0ABY7LJK2_9GAMM|nr:hypothetical protein [Salinivibrio proteolyticus]WBA16387.1 hypothetical protein N7E60_16770 [Salinivibrio proteolyticus]